MSSNNEICYSTKINNFSSTKQGLTCFSDAIFISRRWNCHPFVFSCNHPARRLLNSLPCGGSERIAMHPLDSNCSPSLDSIVEFVLPSLAPPTNASASHCIAYRPERQGTLATYRGIQPSALRSGLRSATIVYPALAPRPSTPALATASTVGGGGR